MCSSVVLKQKIEGKMGGCVNKEVSIGKRGRPFDMEQEK